VNCAGKRKEELFRIARWLTCLRKTEKVQTKNSSAPSMQPGWLANPGEQY